ncbi:15029_t:CDS:2, partial [Funneliformis geosporum]
LGLYGVSIKHSKRNNSYQPLSSHKIMQIKDSDVREKKIDKHFQDEAPKYIPFTELEKKIRNIEVESSISIDLASEGSIILG